MLIDVLNYILQPKQQAIAYDAGYFYPGPAVKDVTIEMAPQESQDTISEFGRPDMPTGLPDKLLEGRQSRSSSPKPSGYGRKDRLRRRASIQPVAGAGCDSRCRPIPS